MAAEERGHPCSHERQGGGWRLVVEAGWMVPSKRRDESLDNMSLHDPFLPPFQITRAVVQTPSSAIPRSTVVASNVSHQPLNLGQVLAL